MATKIISTRYTATISHSTGGSERFEFSFKSIGELKSWLSKFSASYSTSNSMKLSLSKITSSWDDTSKTISTSSLALTADDL